MRKWTLMTTVAAASIAASAVVAQTSDPRDQNQTKQPPAAASDQRTPQPSQNNAGQTQSTQPGTSGQNSQAQQPNTAAQSAPSSNTAGQTGAQPSNQTTAAPSNNQNATQSNTPASQQSTQAPSSNQPSSAAQTTPSAQPSQQTGQTSPAQSQPAQNRSAEKAPDLDKNQQTRISAIVSQQKVEPVTRVNFSVNVGVAVPGDITLHRVPSDIIAVVPQYRDYSYFVTTDRIVIVEPSTHRIVYVMPYEGSNRAAATTTSHKRNLNLTDSQRQVIRKHAARPHRETTGTRVRREVTVEEEVPSSVELEEFSGPVVREVPAMRGYRYYRNDNDIVVVDPGERRVLDVIR